MAIKVINVGTKANGGGGDALRDAMIKINENFTELYDRTGGDVASSIIGADSTVLVDGPNSSLNADALTGTAPAGVVTFPNISNTPTTVAGYGITDAYTKAQTNQQIAIETNDIKSDLASGSAGAIDASVLTGSLPAIDGSALTGITAGTASSLDGDMTGSVYADDSTLLVDGVSGTIPAANLTGALPAIDGSALTDVEAATSNTTVFTARADVDLLMGEVVYITGISGNTPTIDKAQANAAGTMPAFGIVKADVTANNTVEVVTFGSCPGHDAANFAETGITFALGDTVYVSATEAGKLTNVAPAGESNLIQNIGKIERATPTTNMTIKVGGAGRTNATPALDEGNIFIGNAQNRSSTMSLSTAMSTYGGDFEGNLTGSVFADDSTLLVDGVNGTLNSSALTKPITLADNEKIIFGNDDNLEIFHNSSNGNTIIDNNTGNLVIKGSNLFLQSASSEYFFRGAANGAVTIYHDNVAKFETTTDGISVTDHIALPDSGELRLGTDNDMQILHSGATGFIKSTTGTLVLQGSTVRIQDAGSSQTAISAADGIATLLFENTAVLNTTAGGIQIEQGVEEKFATLTGSTGVVAHDCDNGHVFYHTGAAGDITANFTNLGLTAEYGTNLTVIINQGATPYEVTAVQIGGVAQTINWQGGTPPTGNANGIDSFSFTVLNDGGTYVVLGQMVDFT